MPLRLMILHDEAVELLHEIKQREDYISVLELENLRLRLRLKIIVGGAKGLIIWSVSLMIVGLVMGPSQLV
jgi:hypothetical protein